MTRLPMPGQYNANGMTFADGLNDWCTGTDIPSGNYSEVWLLRFEDLGLPAGAQVVAATLTVHGSAGQYFAGSYLAAAWHGDTPISRSELRAQSSRVDRIGSAGDS